MFIKACLTVPFLLLPFALLAQQSTPASTTVSAPATEIVAKPRFKGDLDKYLANNINYPVAARDKGIQGRCVVEFMVDEQGKIRRIENVVSSGNSALDAEAERIVASMPAWRPGRSNQRPVRYFYSIPINFELE